MSEESQHGYLVSVHEEDDFAEKKKTLQGGEHEPLTQLVEATALLAEVCLGKKQGKDEFDCQLVGWHELDAVKLCVHDI